MAYTLLMQRAALGGEVNEAMDKIKGRIREELRIQETGLPSIASLFPPLNEGEF